MWQRFVSSQQSCRPLHHLLYAAPHSKRTDRAAQRYIQHDCDCWRRRNSERMRESICTFLALVSRLWLHSQTCISSRFRFCDLFSEDLGVCCLNKLFIYVILSVCPSVHFYRNCAVKFSIWKLEILIILSLAKEKWKCDNTAGCMAIWQQCWWQNCWWYSLLVIFTAAAKVWKLIKVQLLLT